jgi:DNA-directed RNA polymerase specialized sigma24 family protein
MTASVTPLRREGGPLTREQRALVRSVPGLAEHVVFDLSRELGGDPHSPDRVNIAHLGIYKAAQRYDPELGAFRPWASFLATFEILMVERKDGKQKRLLTAGRIAGFRYLAERQHRADDIPADATNDELMGELTGFAQGQLVADLLGTLAAAEEPAEGDDEVAERDAWAQALTALGGVLASLKPEHREMLLLFAHGHPVKSIAKARSVDYSKLLEDFHEQLALVRARLEGQKVTSVPTAPKDAVPVLPEPKGPGTPLMDDDPPSERKP